jgi:hypothetical protein
LGKFFNVLSKALDQRSRTVWGASLLFEQAINLTPVDMLQAQVDILGAMKQPRIFFKTRRLAIIAVVSSLALFAGQFYLYGQDKSEFPDGYDAVQAAPNSHKVVFENAFVRVLEVTVPAAGKTEPMHHHRWPSFFLDWDTGGGMPHVRYHRPDGTIRDSPSKEVPVHSGTWTVQWMNPEPMHAIEVVEMPRSAASVPNGPPLLRIEIKCHP